MGQRHGERAQAFPPFLFGDRLYGRFEGKKAGDCVRVTCNTSERTQAGK